MESWRTLINDYWTILVISQGSPKKSCICRRQQCVCKQRTAQLARVPPLMNIVNWGFNLAKVHFCRKAFLRPKQGKGGEYSSDGGSRKQNWVTRLKLSWTPTRAARPCSSPKKIVYDLYFGIFCCILFRRHSELFASFFACFLNEW